MGVCPLSPNPTVLLTTIADTANTQYLGVAFRLVMTRAFVVVTVARGMENRGS